MLRSRLIDISDVSPDYIQNLITKGIITIEYIKALERMKQSFEKGATVSSKSEKRVSKPETTVVSAEPIDIKSILGIVEKVLQIFVIQNNNVLTNLDLASLSKIFGFLEIRNNNILDVSAINNCDFFVYKNNGYKCEFGEVNISGNSNNNYCFQDSAKIQQPTLLTTVAFDVTQTTATSGGSVNSPQGTIMKRKGVCWSTSQNPTVDDNISDNGYGNDDFNSYIYGLLPNTTYHYRAYAEDCNGIYYGNEMSFTTPQ